MTSQSLPFLPYGRHVVDDADVRAVERVLKSDYLTSGSVTTAFETKLAEKTGAKNAVSVSSGTAALHLSALSLNLGPGDIVVAPTITFVATANAVRYVGAEVVFTDVDPETGLMRPKDLLRALEQTNGRAKALFLVHLAGQCPDMEGIIDIARTNNLAIVEDASHALGTTYCNRGIEYAVGSCADSDITIFSFHAVKTIAMGEGGAITTNDQALAARLKRLRSHGVERSVSAFKNHAMAFTEEGNANPWYYEMQELGFNYRSSDIHCALGLSQLAKLEEFVSRRRYLVGLYDKILATMGPNIRVLSRNPNCNPAWHLCVVLFDFGAITKSRANLMEQLYGQGIGTQVHYIPVHYQPYYAKTKRPDLPDAQKYYERCLSLPLFPSMADSDVTRVCDTIGDALRVN